MDIWEEMKSGALYVTSDEELMVGTDGMFGPSV